MILPHRKQRQSTFNQYPKGHDAALVRQTNHVWEPENRKELSPIKVLVVEDTEICQKIALFMLRPPFYRTVIAGTGKEALEKYSQGYDVILVDLGLPDMSGLDVCRHIWKKIGDVNTPIIAYSANSDSFYEECVEAGFSQVLLKPTDKKTLDKSIKKLLGNKGSK